MQKGSHILVVDFGSQTTMLIARRIRELGVLAKVVPPTIAKKTIESDLPWGVILSGGPESLLDDDAIRMDEGIFDLRLPMLGICYGMQLMVDHFGGTITRACEKEFGQRTIDIDPASTLFHTVPERISVWMSHSDQVDLSNTAFRTIGRSMTCAHAAVADEENRLFGVQFHPEVTHGEYGDLILRNFVFGVACAERNFDIGDFLNEKIASIKKEVGDAHVIMGLSGGVDSSVAAVLINRAIHSQLHCVYVNHGLHRQSEIEEITKIFDPIGLDLHVVDAREQFFQALAGVTEPEEKRKIIGRVFIDVFEAEAKRLPQVKFLGQGTLYPDVIESAHGKKGPSQVIKSHHNVGGLPERMNLQLLEPLRDLFKDEVRILGGLLGLPKQMIERQPFPGPGLAVRIPGAISQERIKILREADAIVRQEIDEALVSKHIEVKLWQWFAILLPVKSVGVMGDARSYGETIVIRCVQSLDAMTADWARLPYDILARMSSRITNEVMGVTRVLYDITQKPPGTIEWE